MEPVSAFSVYGTKYKSTEQLLNEKKKKQNKASNRKQKDAKQINVKQQMRNKGILNIFAKDRDKVSLHQKMEFNNLNSCLYVLQIR